MAKKKLNRHELKEDAVIEFFLKAYEYIKTHQNAVFVGLIVLILIVAGSFWYRNSVEEARMNAANRFAEASMFFYSGDLQSAKQIFEVVRDNYGGTREGVYSLYYLGKCANATGEYREAIGHFNKYLDKSGDYPFFREAAQLSIAVAMENNREFEKAAEKYLSMYESASEDENKGEYLEKAAECYELAGMDTKAAEIYRKALPYREGLAAKKIEVKIDILSH